MIPIWGAKRARSCTTRVDLLCDDETMIPIWRSKQQSNPFNLTEFRRDDDWANIGEGPAGLIAEHLLAAGDVADYISFRAVCHQWRICSTDPRAHGILDTRFLPHQWIMLRKEEEAEASPHRRRFLNTFTGCTRSLDLPELDGHDVFGPTTEGLLVLLDTDTCVLRLLNPLTRQMSDLPPTSSLITCEDLERFSSMKDLFQVCGAGLADNFTIAVHFRNIKTIAIAKPGDAQWTVVDRGSWFLPAMSFEGRFYCATTRDVMVVETSSADHQPPRLVTVAKLTKPFSRMMEDTVHLVDIDGKLILVDRKCNGNDHRKFEVYQVDLVAREMVPVRGLGGRAVFIGKQLALSVSPSVFPSVCADAVYLGFDDMMTGRFDRSPVHLMDGTVEPRLYHQYSIDGMPVYEPLGVDEHLSWCVTGYRVN
ncbi:hypothetical protein HU200_028702 [Digitaria exilis]|uniref:KIB1-4 beta-propeller domain-containing protein n=1 Tax=Digitaria exilis TaxID=1010633 RepID=A0A835BSE8_9POAL|nr:hypothetical protein HU200_028702 [Digitaria exilis]CAB3482175.1 unnamed protein product [Digitaria exilis]